MIVSVLWLLEAEPDAPLIRMRVPELLDADT